MRTRTILFVIMILTLSAWGCSGGSGDQPFLTSTSTSADTSPASTSPAVTTTEVASEANGEVGPEGLLLEFDRGGNLDVPAGATGAR